MSIATIKQAIKTKLDELVVSETLAEASIHDIKQDPLNVDIAVYPHAFLMPPAIESEGLDNVDNVRTYTFEIVVLFKGDDLASTTELEDKVEAMLNKFDNSPTLGGAANAGMSPMASAPMALNHKGGTIIMVVLTLKARESILLTYE